MGHEIGHQPWTWPEGDMGPLTKKDLDAMYREEEAKADRFAGRVLAEMGANPDAVCEFLKSAEKFEAHKPTDYYPADVRAQMIDDAYKRRHRAIESGNVSILALRRIRDLR